MTRAVLVLALAVSLWPVGAIAAIFATGGQTSTNTSTDSSYVDATTDTYTDTAPEESAPPAEPPAANYAAWDRLTARRKKLMRQVKNNEALFTGQAQAQLVTRSQRLVRAYRRWRQANGDALDASERRVALREQQLVARIEDFTQAPSQARIDAVNAAITAYNRSLK